MKHFDLELEKLEQRIAPGGFRCSPKSSGGGSGSGSKGKGSGSKGKGSGSKGKGSKGKGSKS